MNNKVISIFSHKLVILQEQMHMDDRQEPWGYYGLVC